MLVKIRGKNIKYQKINSEFADISGTVMVFLHDGLGSIKQWKDIPQQLSESLKIPALVYERHGFGESEIIESHYERDIFKKEAYIRLPSLLDKVKFTNKIILVGLSDGATIALLYASEFPDKVASVVSIAGHVINEEETIAGVRKGKIAYDSGELKKALQKYHGLKTDFVFKRWFEIWTSKEFKDLDIIDRLKLIKSPVCVIQGDRDEYGTEKQVEIIKNNVAGKAETHIIKDSGHFPHIEKREEVMGIITKFIKDN